MSDFVKGLDTSIGHLPIYGTCTSTYSGAPNSLLVGERSGGSGAFNPPTQTNAAFDSGYIIAEYGDKTRESHSIDITIKTLQTAGAASNVTLTLEKGGSYVGDGYAAKSNISLKGGVYVEDNVVGTLYSNFSYSHYGVSMVVYENTNGGYVFEFLIYISDSSTRPDRPTNRVAILFNTPKMASEYQVYVEATKSSAEYGEPSDQDGYGQGTGGYGSYDKSSDVIAIADDPDVQVSDAGFVNIYHVSKNQLQRLGAEIFPSMTAPSLPAAGSSLTDVCNAIIGLISSFFTFFSESIFNSRLIDYIIDCHVIPCAPTDGASGYIQLGGRELSYTAPKVASDYITVDCGSLSIAEYYANFLDYYTVCKLYLPFIGFVDLKNEFFQSGTINVTYKFNVIDGSFVCYVRSTSSKSALSNSVIAQYSGAACLHIPITGANYASMIAGVANGVTQVATGAATGNVGAAMDGAMNVLSAAPEMQQSNGYNSTGAFMGIRYPYLLIERVVPSFSESYTHENGLPFNVAKKLSDINGYTVCDNADVSGVDGATDDELAEIKALLESGVYL